MSSQDWRDALASLADKLPADEPETVNDIPDTDSKSSSGIAHIALERKGRAGKTATIIYDLTITDDETLRLAADLKRSLGCGGSVRGNEILIQGDRVADCRRILASRGFKVK